ncbi:MAG: hydrogenase maturation nickel metallochaperone HypA [Alphaproteobacteria bacterium]|nr:hydrogenase maturation nickel metallochaperone HypA [Alphaproteobacteria bacterium]
MHELSIAQSIVEMVGERAGDARVHRLTLVIGRLSGVMPDALRFCFDVCAEGTVLEGAILEIIEPSGRGRCLDCGREQEITSLFEMCVCGATGLDCVTGNELRIKEMEMA